MYNANSEVKWVYALKLAQLAAELPAHAALSVTIAGNVKIVVDGVYYGYIDFNTEEIVKDA